MHSLRLSPLRANTALIALFMLISGEVAHAQTASFICPDTVCSGESIAITNTSAGGSTYYWNFCSGNANQNPTGINIGNPGNLLDIPTYITLVKEGSNCWSFVSCQGVGVVRYYHGNSFKNNPISWTNLGTFGGTITFSQEGIQVKEDNGTWYGFVCSDTKLVRLNFGSSPANTPTATSLNFTGLNMLHGLQIENEGGTWIGLATCSTGNKLVRFNFGSMLSGMPVMTDFGNVGGFSTPSAICIVQENNFWYALVMAGANSISRITFGSSLLNTPTGVNLGNPGGMNSAGGLTLIRDCGSTTGYFTNYLSPGQLGKLTFPTGITGGVTGQVLGNIGNLDKPHSFSELFRQNDTLFAYITNRQNGTLTRLTFPPCSNASVPSSTLFNPPLFSYNTPGTYNIRLILNEGMPTQSVLCKSIVVLAAPCNTVAVFAAPDTVCTGQPVTIANQSTTGATYYWSFCTGSALSNPVGTNIGNPGNLLNIPCHMTLVKDGSTCYSFLANQGIMAVVRYNHGSSFSNNPVSWTNLGSFGYLSDTVMGIKICNENGTYIGFVNNNNRIVRLNFGTSPGNTPTATLLGPYAMLNTAASIDIFQENGNWVGYVTCTWGNKLVRLTFGSSLLNQPVLTDLGNAPGSMNMPGPARFIQENGIWYCLVANQGSNTLTRLTFGTSLFNNPTGVNLGTVCPGITSGGITLIRDCNTTTGFQLNYSLTSPDLIWRLNFPEGITGPVTGISLGNIGNLNRPSNFSELFRMGDTLYLYAINRQNFTLTRLKFLPCTNASIPSSTLYNPPPFSYNQPGVYNIQLIVNEGLPTQASLCKNVVVQPPPVVNLGPDQGVCEGQSATFNAGACNGCSYLWGNLSTGQPNIGTGPTYTTGTPGIYTVRVTTADGCISRDTAELTINPAPVMNPIPPLEPVCSGTTILVNLSANLPGTVFSWTVSASSPFLTGCYGGTGNVISQTLVNNSASLQTATYQVTPFIGTCTGAPSFFTVTVKPVPQVFLTPAMQEVCSGATAVIQLTPNVAGTQVTWTAACLSPAVTGYGPGTGLNISQQLSNNSYQTEEVIYSAIPEAQGCTGLPGTSHVLVKPLPDLSFSPSALNICSGDSAVIMLNSQLSGTGYSWVAQPGSPAITNVNDGSGGWIRQRPLNTGAVTGTVTYLVTPQAAGCTGNPGQVVTTVKPVPITTILNAAGFVCSESLFTADLSSPTTGATFSWTASSLLSTITGFSGGTGSLISQLLLNPGTSAGEVAYVVTASAEGCTGTPAEAVVEVRPLPDAVATPQMQTICNGTLGSIQVSSSATGAAFTWTVSSSALFITGFSGGSGALISQNLFNSGLSPGTVSYLISASANNCLSHPSEALVEVNPVADVTVVPAGMTLCEGSSTQLLLQSQVAGSTFAWTASGTSGTTGFGPGTGNMINQQLHTSLNTSGTVVYQAESSFAGCQGLAAQAQVVVNPSTEIVFHLCSDTITLVTATPFSMRGGWPGGGYYKGPGIDTANGTFSPASAGPGMISLSYNYTNAYGCKSFQTSGIRVYPAQAFTCGDVLTDLRDGNQYPTCSMPDGSCWMASSLRYGAMISSVQPQTDNCSPERYCKSDNPAGCLQYGGYYQWDELMDHLPAQGAKGLCPPGWHVPTTTEWEMLATVNNGAGQAGGPLKDPWLTNGFRSKQSGIYYQNRFWAFIDGLYAGTMYWTSSATGSGRAVARGLNAFQQSVSRYEASRNNAFQVRCAKNP